MLRNRRKCNRRFLTTNVAHVRVASHLTELRGGSLALSNCKVINNHNCCGNALCRCVLRARSPEAANMRNCVAQDAHVGALRCVARLRRRRRLLRNAAVCFSRDKLIRSKRSAAPTCQHASAIRKKEGAHSRSLLKSLQTPPTRRWLVRQRAPFRPRPAALAAAPSEPIAREPPSPSAHNSQALWRCQIKPSNVILIELEGGSFWAFKTV